MMIFQAHKALCNTGQLLGKWQQGKCFFLYPCASPSSSQCSRIKRTVKSYRLMLFLANSPGVEFLKKEHGPHKSGQNGKSGILIPQSYNHHTMTIVLVIRGGFLIRQKIMKVLTWAISPSGPRLHRRHCGACLTRTHGPPTRIDIDCYLFLSETASIHSPALQVWFVPCVEWCSVLNTVYRVCRYTRRKSLSNNPPD